MENTEKKNNNPATGAALEEAVLKYLADNHPDDDKALDEMMQLLQGESDKLVEAVYKGLRYARDVDAASADGYLRGRRSATHSRNVRKTMAAHRPTTTFRCSATSAAACGTESRQTTNFINIKNTKDYEKHNQEND